AYEQPPAPAPQGEVSLYHSSPKKFGAFTGQGTETGLGGKAFYFSDKPEAAYGENVVKVNVPTNKILNLEDVDSGKVTGIRNDADIKKAGYEGTLNPSTGEYTIYDPNKFITKGGEVSNVQAKETEVGSPEGPPPPQGASAQPVGEGQPEGGLKQPAVHH